MKFIKQNKLIAMVVLVVVLLGGMVTYRNTHNLKHYLAGNMYTVQFKEIDKSLVMYFGKDGHGFCAQSASEAKSKSYEEGDKQARERDRFTYKGAGTKIEVTIGGDDYTIKVDKVKKYLMTGRMNSEDVGTKVQMVYEK